MAKEIPVEIHLGEDLPLGSRIRLVRQQREVRLSAMARELGYDRGYLSKIENNVVLPSDELLEKIADYLEISIPDLKAAPLSHLAPEYRQKKPIRRAGFVLAGPPISSTKKVDGYETQKRTIGERIERLIKMAHLSEEEEGMVEERLIAVASELLKLVKDTRQVR